MKHNLDGKTAEDKTALHLSTLGYQIIGRNWKTPRCEIDIVAKKNGTIYFVEVKYRSSTSYGEGFEYITPARQRQMAFAAKMWVASNAWSGEFALSAASVSGPEFEVQFIEQI